MKKNIVLLLVAILFPAIVFAVEPPETFRDIVLIFINLIISAIPLVAGLALLAFVWGLAKFILHAGEEKGREEGKQIMKWGVIALFVLVSIFGILTFLYNQFGFGNIGIPRLPVDISSDRLPNSLLMV